MNQKTSIFSNSLLWFGAGISLAEIITGTYFAPLGFFKGTLAIVIGHIIGCALLFGAGVISGKTQKSAMNVAKMSFGDFGGRFFALLNVLQLVGWTAIMIYDGAVAANSIFNNGKWIWCVVIGGLIVVWILIGITNIKKINIVAVSSLFVLTIVLCKVIFGNAIGAVEDAKSSLSFGAALELSIAMPLSWLPLIGDYTKDAEKPVHSTLASAVVYGLVSSWMYLIGMSSAIFTGESDVVSIMTKAGLGIVALVVVVLSTVTTTFLDAFSSGVSTTAIFPKISSRLAAIITCVVGTIFAILFPMDDITDFLYLIGSVFAPMIAIELVDYQVLGIRGKDLGESSQESSGQWTVVSEQCSISQESGCPSGSDACEIDCHEAKASRNDGGSQVSDCHGNSRLEMTEGGQCEHHKNKRIDFLKMLVWVVGFVVYRVLMRFDLPVGNTILAMLVTGGLEMMVGKILKETD